MVQLDDFKKFDFQHISTKDFFEIEALLAQLIIERETYREVAIDHDIMSHAKHPRIHRKDTEKYIDAVARQMMEKK